MRVHVTSQVLYIGLGFSDCWSCSDPGQSGFENAGGEELGDDALFCDRGKMTRHA